MTLAVTLNECPNDEAWLLFARLMGVLHGSLCIDAEPGLFVVAGVAMEKPQRLC